MIDNQTNFLNLFIAKNVSTSAVAANTFLTAGLINTGEVVLTDAAGRVITNAVAQYTPFKIAMKNANGKLVWSDVIDPVKITGVRHFLSSEQHEKIEYLGYNRSTGSINVQNSTLYEARILLLPQVNSDFAQQKFKYMVYKSDSAATQAEIAAGLVVNLANNYAAQREPDVVVERVYSTACSELDGNSNYVNWVVTQGSDIVSCVNADLTASLAVGTYLNLAGLTFIITASSYVGGTTNVVTLDAKWQRASGIVIASDTTVVRTINCTNGDRTVALSQAHGLTAGGVCYIGIANNGATSATAEFYSGVIGATATLYLDEPFRGTTNAACIIADDTTATSGNWRIRISGVTRNFQAGMFQYDKMDFNVTMMNGFNTNGTTIQTASLSATTGIGWWKDIAEREWNLQWNRRSVYTSGNPSDTLIYGVEANTVSDHYYNVIIIDYKQEDSSSLGATTSMPKQIMIVGDSGIEPATVCGASSINDATNGLRKVLGEVIYNSATHFDATF